MFAVINTLTGRLLNGKIHSTHDEGELVLENLDYNAPRLSQAFDLFELTENGWEHADRPQGVKIPYVPYPHETIRALLVDDFEKSGLIERNESVFD